MTYSDFEEYPSFRTLYKISRYRIGNNPDDVPRNYGFVMHTDDPENARMIATLDKMVRVTAIKMEQFGNPTEAKNIEHWYDDVFLKGFDSIYDARRKFVLRNGCTEDCKYDSERDE